MKNVTGQSVTEIHRGATPQQARSFSMALSFNQLLQSKDWEFRRHLCHYYNREWANHVANIIINLAEASQYGPAEQIDTTAHNQLLKAKATEFRSYLGSAGPNSGDPTSAHGNEKYPKLHFLPFSPRGHPKDNLVARQVSELKRLRDKLTDFVTTINVTSPLKKTKSH